MKQKRKDKYYEHLGTSIRWWFKVATHLAASASTRIAAAAYFKKEKGRNVTITPADKKIVFTRVSLILQFQNRLGNIFFAI